MKARENWHSPGLARRFACAVYELLILAALVLVAGFPFLAFIGDATGGWRRHLMQAFVLAVVGAYFVWFWTHGGQTLAMKTWRIRLESLEGGAVPRPAAIRRYLFALAGLAALGVGFLWAFLDRDRQFLHDRLARTRLAAAGPARP
ncbi:MAG: RDD family protein [Betaproteobacteria bacterium]|nr:RDD family protein [Betaproteobacteria bacterium]